MCRNKSPHHGRSNAACAHQHGHHRVAVAAQVSGVAVGDVIFGTGHHHDALVAAGHGLGDLKRVGFECAGINAFVAVAGLG